MHVQSHTFQRFDEDTRNSRCRVSERTSCRNEYRLKWVGRVLLEMLSHEGADNPPDLAFPFRIDCVVADVAESVILERVGLV